MSESVRPPRPSDARVRFAVLELVQGMWAARNGAPAEEVAAQVRAATRIMHPYAVEKPELSDVERAFGQVRGWVDASSLLALVKRRDPLLTLRCKADGRALAAVWSTAIVGPLLVTGHLHVSELEGDSHRAARLKAAGLDVELWAPRLGVLDGIGRDATLSEDLLPLVCAKCHRQSPLNWPALYDHVTAARTTRPRQIRI